MLRPGSIPLSFPECWSFLSLPVFLCGVLDRIEENFFKFLLKFIELERRLQRLLGKKVDVVRKEAIRPVIKEDILKEVRYI